MKKVLIAAICVLVLLVGIIVVDMILTRRTENLSQVTASDVKPSAEADTEASTSSDFLDFSTTLPSSTQLVTKDRNAQVQFTMPLFYLEEKYKNDLELFCKENNYIACTVDEQNQTFTVTMNAMTHDFMLSNVGLQSIKNMANVIQSETFPFFKKLVSYNDNFSEITVSVDSSIYKADTTDRESFQAFIAGCGIYYQLYTVENEYSCRVIVTDDESGEIIDVKQFRQNNSGVIS